MMNPGTALIIAFGCIVLLALLFWPRIGLVASVQRLRRGIQRVLMEDALKHLYDCEYRKLTCTQKSIAGALSISGDEAARLLAKLETLGLLQSKGDTIVPTEEGRSYALRVIRMHRLWERYLADETGVAETEWHNRAERAEHRLTLAEADALAASMGNPPYDPHGDPIPTPAGELPRAKGQPLTSLGVGEFGEIVHIEDEPGEVYAQLVALGLHPGMRMRVIGATRDRIRFEANGVESVIAPVVGANVTVIPLTEEFRIEGPHETLASLKPGEMASVIGISGSCRGLQRRRLLDLGIVPGTAVSAEMRSPGGDPTAYLVRGALFALRRKQASMVHIQREEKETT